MVHLAISTKDTHTKRDKKHAIITFTHGICATRVPCIAQTVSHLSVSTVLHVYYENFGTLTY